MTRPIAGTGAVRRCGEVRFRRLMGATVLAQASKAAHGRRIPPISMESLPASSGVNTIKLLKQPDHKFRSAVRGSINLVASMNRFKTTLVITSRRSGAANALGLRAASRMSISRLTPCALHRHVDLSYSTGTRHTASVLKDLANALPRFCGNQSWGTGHCRAWLTEARGRGCTVADAAPSRRPTRRGPPWVAGGMRLKRPRLQQSTSPRR